MTLKTPINAKQSKRAERLEEDVSLDILRTAAALEHFFTEGIRLYGLTPTQYNVLRILRGAGPSGLCRNDVRDRMLTPVGDATRLIDRLIAAGYAKKTKNPDDKRFITTRITEKGLKLLSDLDEPVLDMHRTLLGHLPKSDLKTLSTLLKAIRKQP